MDDRSIPPFPATIDRNYFGAWLAGFTDGEGSFILREFKNNRGGIGLQVAFRIGLRNDDRAALELVRSFFQCGYIHVCKRKPGKKDGYESKPICHFIVDNRRQLADVIVPFFDRNRLIAKKHRDFLIWRRAVILLAKQHKPTRIRPVSADVVDEFRHMQRWLKNQRRYETNGQIIEEPRTYDPCPLFTCLP